MKKQLLLFIIFIFQVGYAQIPAGTFVFTNGGGAGLKNLWNNSFNWSIADGLGGFITSGTPPTPTDNVLIDISSILVSGPVIGGVSSNSVIIIDDVASCKTFSLLNTTPNKGLLFTTTNAALNVNGHFDLSGPTSFSVNRAYGYLYGKLNFLGTSTSPFNIKTNNNNIELFDINISGSYILQDNFNQTPIVFTNAQTNFNITGSSPNFNTNNKSIRTTVFYIKNDVVSPVLDFQNSNIKSCFFQVEGSPTTYTYNTSLANIQLTDTLGAFNSGFIRYNFNTGISSFSVNTINCSSTTKALINAGYTHVFTNSLTTNCNTEFGNYVNGTQVGIEATNFIITKSALISGYTNAYSPYPFKCTSIIVPGTCDKQVTFVSSTSYAYNMNIQNANTLNYTNWGDINILGPGSIVANNSSDLGGNMGSITINISAPKTLAWCGGATTNDWNDPLNWMGLSPLTSCGTCLPTFNDSVVFAPAYLSSGASWKSANIPSAAFCKGISFNYPTSNSFSLTGNSSSILFNQGGLWIGYNGSLIPNTNTGLVTTGFFGSIHMNSTNKSNIIATQGVAFNSMLSMLFYRQGKWYFKDDFTAINATHELRQGYLKLNLQTGLGIPNNTIKFNRAFFNQSDGDAIGLGTTLEMDTAHYILACNGCSPPQYPILSISGSRNLKIKGEASTFEISGSYPNYISINNNYADDILGNRNIEFGHLLYSNPNGVDQINTSIYYNSSPLKNYYARKLTFNGNAELTGSVPPSPLLSIMEVDTLDIKAGYSTSIESNKSIKVNQAIITGTNCGSSYGNLSASNTLSVASVFVPSDFGATKLVVSNVTINNGTGTLTATNSIFTGTTSGWSNIAGTGNKFYWNGEGITTNWTEARNWNVNIPPVAGLANDGAFNSGNCIPTPLDSVFFENNSFPSTATQSVNLVGPCSARTVVWKTNSFSSSTINWKGSVGSSLNIYESLYLNKAVNITYGTNSQIDGITNFYGTFSNDTIKSDGVPFSGSVYIKTTNPYHLKDSLTVNNLFFHEYGVFKTLGNNMNLWNFKSILSLNRVLDLSHSKIMITALPFYSPNAYNLFGNEYYYGGTGSWFLNTDNLLLKADSSQIIFAGNNNGSLYINRMVHRGSSIANYGRVLFMPTSLQNASEIRSLNDNILHFKSINFKTNSEMYSSLSTDTLRYAPMTTNKIEATKMVSIDTLIAISNNCQFLSISSTSGGSYADLCDKSSNKLLTATFADIKDVRSNTCFGFSSINQSYNGSVVNSPGWAVNTMSLTFGFPIHTYTSSCKDSPLTFNSSNFYAGSTSSYLWSTGSTASAITATQSGTYSLTVTYKPGCALTDIVTLNIINTMVGAYSVTPVSCNGFTNGIVSFSLTSDSSYAHSYEYKWDTPTPSSTSVTLNSLTNSYSNLSPGTYTLTLTDITSSPVDCKYTQTVSVTEPLPLLIVASTNSILCFGATTGTLNASPSGGNPIYTYTWTNGSSTYNTQNVSNVSTGIYSLTVTDTKNCIATNTLEVLQPTSALTSSISSTSNVLCNGASTGSAIAAAAGGTGVLTYSWVPSGITTATATSLASTIYTITVTDDNACISTNTLGITQPSSILSIASLVTNSVLCYGASSGSITILVTGGTPSYTTNWSGPSSYTAITSGITNTIPAMIGTYSATITDANGCITNTTVLVTAPTTSLSIALTGSVTPTNCLGNTGIASVNSSGGTGTSYVYTWTNSTGTTTTSNASNTMLPVGTTTVVIADGNNCNSNTITINISAFGAPTVAITTNSVLCSGGNGSANATVTGTSPYNYTWQASSSNTNISGSLAAGLYTVLVNEITTGCKTIQSFTITEPTAISNTITNTQHVTCYGDSTGSATIMVTGGTPVYNYNWLPSGGIASTASNLAQGSYTVLITDANSCTKINTVQILSMSQNIDVTITNITKPDCGNATNGSVSVAVIGGTPLYTYLWNNGNTSATNANLSSASYTLMVTDANNCNKQLEIELDCFTSLSIPELISPDGDGKNDKFEIKGIYYYPNNQLKIYNRWGNLVYSKIKYDNTFDGKPNVSNSNVNGLLPSGTYFVIFDFGDVKTMSYKGYMELKY